MPLSKNHNFDNHLTVGYLPGMDNWLLVGDLLRLGRIFVLPGTGQLLVNQIFTWNWMTGC